MLGGDNGGDTGLWITDLDRNEWAVCRRTVEWLPGNAKALRVDVEGGRKSGAGGEGEKMG